MPAPAAALLESPANGFFSAGGLLGEDAPALAKALADSAGQALNLFLAQALVLPGMVVAADPISGSGATAGPGLLLAPPAGGPGAPQLENLVKGFLNAQALQGEDAGALASVIAGALAQGIALFAAQSMVLPGIAVAGFVSVAPGMLAPVPVLASLQPIVDGLMQQNGLRGEDAPHLAKAITQLVDLALMQFAAQALVSPGIACPPGASAGPGRLL